jgi:hypothetical protein
MHLNVSNVRRKNKEQSYQTLRLHSIPLSPIPPFRLQVSLIITVGPIKQRSYTTERHLQYIL